MSKLKCPYCGAKIREIDEVCEDCGGDLHKYIEQDDDIISTEMDRKINEFMDKRKKEKIEDEILNDIDYDSLEVRTYKGIEALRFSTNLIKILWSILGISIFIMGVINNSVVELIFAIGILILIPVVGVPLVWMQLMLENVSQINKDANIKRK